MSIINPKFILESMHCYVFLVTDHSFPIMPFYILHNSILLCVVSGFLMVHNIILEFTKLWLCKHLKCSTFTSKIKGVYSVTYVPLSFILQGLHYHNALVLRATSQYSPCIMKALLQPLYL